MLAVSVVILFSKFEFIFILRPVRVAVLPPFGK